jgi:hypothetical protein
MDSGHILSAVVGLITAFLINGVGWFLVRSQRAKTNAEAADIITGSALKLVQELRQQVADLRTEVDTLEEELGIQKGLLKVVTELNVRLLRGTAILTDQLNNLGEEPCWTIQDAAGKDEELRRELQRLQGELD